jgi:hypothetical protein
VKTLVVALALVTSAYAGVDVGIDTILSPGGTIDSGQTITPRCVVANYGSEPADSVSAYFKIDDGTPNGYSDSIIGLHLEPLATETLAFTAWVPHGRDSMEAIAWTVCAGDTFPHDDTCWQRFLVRVRDIAVLQIIDPAPDTMLDSGEVLYMKCRVWNLGNVSLNFDLRFRIYRLDSTVVYEAFRNLNLIAGGSTVVTAPDSWQLEPGVYIAEFYAIVPGDLHPENNAMSDTFYVGGTITKDVETGAILTPPSVVDTTMVWTPRGRFGNNGVDAASFEAYYLIFNPAGAPVYADSQPVLLGPGESIELDFSNVRLTTIGMYTAACSVYMAGDQNSTNDVMRRRFRVVAKVSPDVGVVEILAPDTLFGGSAETLSAVWRNYGIEPATYSAYFFLQNKYGVRVYSESRPDNYLAAGARDTLFEVTLNVGNDTGRWMVRCSTASGDTNFANDTLDKYMYVLWRPGIEETMSDECRVMSAGPTILHASDVKRLASGVVFDAMGRRVLSPKYGVYFVRDEGRGAGDAGRMQKVVIQR